MGSRSGWGDMKLRKYDNDPVLCQGRGVLFFILTLVLILGCPFLLSFTSQAKSTDSENLSFYQKLAQGQDVNILIVGDSIGAGSGADESDGVTHVWFNLLKNDLEERYMREDGGSVSVTNISLCGNTSYAGYVRTMQLNDGIDYDLVILCFGQNDDEEDLGVYYEVLIRAVEEKYPACSIISILESSQQDYTDKILELMALCEYYEIPYADTILAFQNSGYSYEELSYDGVHPNNLGQELYFETVRNLIMEQVDAKTGHLEKKEAYYHDEAREFASFVFYPAGDEESDGITELIRENDTTYVFYAPVSGIFGMDYTYRTGDEGIEVYVDGKLFNIHECPASLYSCLINQRYIMTCADTLTAKKEIEIVFANKEQADGFYGICFS